MRQTSIALVLALVPAALFAQAPAMDGDGEAAMLARINALRAEAGAPPLTRDEGLDAAARAHSVDMASHQQLVHVSPRTGDPNARARDAGVQAQRIAQNIARHATTAGALESIVASAPHRSQLLDPSFTHVGLASVASPQGMYVTQVLAQLAPPPAELPPPAVQEAAPRVEPVAPVPATPPPPSFAEAEEEPAAPEAPAEAAPAPVPAAPMVAAAPPPAAQAPMMRVPNTHRRVAGYWIQHGGRWWYFPVPATAQPGQLLQPDLNVQGPPPGYRPPRNSPTRGPAPPPPVAYPAQQQAPRTTPAQTIRWY
ncbi:MAG: CAP domain-containing protein [Sandaracinus sp.]|nr:CAP domain-containing protein [Sandaracinus sp.]